MTVVVTFPKTVVGQVKDLVAALEVHRGSSKAQIRAGGGRCFMIAPGAEPPIPFAWRLRRHRKGSVVDLLPCKPYGTDGWPSPRLVMPERQ